MPIISQPNPYEPNGNTGTIEIQVTPTGTAKYSVSVELQGSGYEWTPTPGEAPPSISENKQLATWISHEGDLFKVDWSSPTAPGAPYVAKLSSGDGPVESSAGQIPAGQSPV